MIEKADSHPNVLCRVIAGFDRVNAAISRVCAVVACTMAVLITTVVFGGVVMRYVFNTPLQWQEEFPKFLMVWMTFTGSVFVIARASTSRWTSCREPCPDGPPPR